MAFEKYWSILLRRWRLVVICFLLVGAGAAIGSKLQTPLYQSTALVQVAIGAGSNPLDYTSLLASDQLVQTEATLATSDSVLREVASHFRGLTADQLSREATASVRLNTQLFEIDVLDPNPSRAAALANDIGSTLIKQQLKITAQGTPQSNLFLVQLAQPSPRPAQPNTLLNTSAGLVVGLLMGVLLALLVERLDKRIKNAEALPQVLGWPILATIWRAGSPEGKGVFNSGNHDDNVESYRVLRANVGFASIDKPLRSLLVTSAQPGEGKSIVASNLAIFMARVGKNTLIVDANLRHPTQHLLFGLPRAEMGLSNAVLAISQGLASSMASARREKAIAPPETSASLDPFIYATDIPNLWILPSGTLPPNPSELLESKAMQRLLAAIAQCGVEVVIFDTPPLLGLSDASILASRVDGAVVVVDVARANMGALRESKALLERTGTRVLGCVVNKQRRSPKDTDNYYSHRGDHQGKADRSAVMASAIPVIPSTEPTLAALDNEEGSENGLIERSDAVGGFDAGEITLKVTRPGRRNGEQLAE